MALADALGWVASALMLMTFSCKGVWCLRCCAVAANLAFITYGLLGDIVPVLTLHLLLLPINAVRLFKARPGAVVALAAGHANARFTDMKDDHDATYHRPDLHAGAGLHAGGLRRQRQFGCTCRHHGRSHLRRWRVGEWRRHLRPETHQPWRQ